MLKSKIVKVTTIVLALVILMSTIVSGDRVFPPDILEANSIDEDNMPLAIQPSQRRNILLTVTADVDNLDCVSVSIYPLTLYVLLMAYSPGMDVSPEDVQCSGNNMVSAVCSFQTGVTATKGKEVFEAYFNTVDSTISASFAKSNIITYIDYALLQNGTVPADPAVTFTMTLLGDINNDNEVDAADALMALQASVQTITLTPDQQRAGDVDRDGDNDAADALSILQYSTAKIISFWGGDTIVAIPTAENPNIVDGHIYRIENAYSGKMMRAVGATAGSAVKQYTYVRTSQSFKFQFRYMGGGAYKIIPQNAPTMVMGINTSGNLVVDTDTGTSQQRWYLANHGLGYYLINKGSITKFLTAEGATALNSSIINSKNTCGSIWKLNNASITINNYYDYGYNVRYPSGPSGYIRACQDNINDAYSEIFDASVTTNTPGLITSYADKCYTDYGQAVTTANIGAWCNHATNAQCENGTFPNHHKCSNNILDYFKSSYGSSSGGYICTLSTGHSVCNLRLNETTGVMEHGHFVSGLAHQFRCMISVCEPNDNPPEYKRRILSINVMMHEQSHNLGAGGNADTQHGKCIMSYNRDRDVLYQDIITGEYSEIYCNACKNAVIDGLKYF